MKAITATLTIAAALTAAAPAQAGCSAGVHQWNSATNALPKCRAAGSSVDLGGSASKGRSMHMRRFFPRLRPGTWKMVDSNGQTIGHLARRSDGWHALNGAGQSVYVDGTPGPKQFEVQGRGCMATERMEKKYALVAFHADDRRKGEAMPYQARSFISRDALPRGYAKRVDDFDTGCGRNVREQYRTVLTSPSFDAFNDKFVGTDGKWRTYGTYNPKPAYAGARYVMVNSTGVYGGGVVRGIIRETTPVGVTNRMAHCDQNFARRGDENPRARWFAIRSKRMHGFIPQRCA